jgi:hypothetical protein
MAAFLRAISDAGSGAINTITLASEKFSNTTLWQRTGGVALPHFKTVASYWPQPLRFNIISKEAAGGAISAVLVGAAINRIRS